MLAADVSAESNQIPHPPTDRGDGINAGCTSDGLGIL